MCGGGLGGSLLSAISPIAMGKNYLKKKKDSAKRKAAAVQAEASRVKAAAKATAAAKKPIQTVYGGDQSQNVIGGGSFGS